MFPEPKVTLGFSWLSIPMGTGEMLETVSFGADGTVLLGPEKWSGETAIGMDHLRKICLPDNGKIQAVTCKCTNNRAKATTTRNK